MGLVSDRVKDTTTTTGTGAITLANTAPTGFITFASGFGSASCSVHYCIAGQGTSEWEVGTGTFDGTTGLTRDTILSSSNSNSVVTFSSGTKDVFCTVPAAAVRGAEEGRQIAVSGGWYLP